VAQRRHGRCCPKESNSAISPAWIAQTVACLLGNTRISARASGTLAAAALSEIDVAAGGDGMPKINVERRDRRCARRRRHSI
jgi:hypothetical protein